MSATTTKRMRPEDTGCASPDCAGCVELARIYGPMVVSPVNNLKRPSNKTSISNKQNKSNKTNKTNKNDKTNKKPIVRLTNKQRIESKLLNLTLDVNALQEEIRSMEFYRTILQARVLFKPQAADGSIVQTAQQYFHIFRRGYRVTEAETQHDYLQATMDAACVTTRCPWAVKLDGLGPTAVGLASLLEQWQTYADYFAFRFLTPPTFTVVSTDADETCVVRCETTLNASFTWQALDMMFPAVKGDPLLMQHLLGREMVTPMCFHLHFDRQRRMVRHDFTPDFFAGLLHAVKDPVLAAEIVSATYGPSIEILDEPEAEAVKVKVTRVEECCGDEEEKPEPTVGNESRHAVAYLLSSEQTNATG